MKSVKSDALREFLDEKVTLYNKPQFIKDDPVSIPHLFSKKEDIEISAFLSATIAWGQRPVIIRNATSLLNRMDNAPHEFITTFKENDLKPFRNFVHRTFNGADCICYLKALKKIHLEHHSIENLFRQHFDNDTQQDFKETINLWRKSFFNIPHQSRTLKHFAHPEEGSAAKRINMFLRWMIRKDFFGVDFGIWKFDPSLLTCPLDVHSARVARKLGLLHRNQNDWKAAKELTDNLRKFDPADPVKYDFALFGLGVFEKF